MKKFFGFLFLTLLLIALPVSAHVLKSDGSIGVLLHLDPDDDPIVGQPANFFFEIKDKDNKFNSTSCNCTVSILDQGKQVFSTNLSVSNDNNINSSAFSYTFPQKGIYSVIVSGTPSSSNAFQQFKVQFDVRVSRDSGTTQGGKSNSWWIIVGAVVVGAIVLAVVYLKK